LLIRHHLTSMYLYQILPLVMESMLLVVRLVDNLEVMLLILIILEHLQLVKYL